MQFCMNSFQTSSTVLHDIINEIAPMKDIWVKGNTNPWLDSNIMEAIRER